MAATHSQDTIDSVRQSLIEGATFGEIGSRLGVSRAVVNGIVARNSMVGLSQHRDVAKAKPEIPRPTRPNVIVKFPQGPNVTPGRYIRELPVETSPRAVTFAAYQPDHDYVWPVSPGMFCGRGKIPKSSYRLRHHRRAYPESIDSNSRPRFLPFYPRFVPWLARAYPEK
jgi:hypothetical protein